MGNRRSLGGVPLIPDLPLERCLSCGADTGEAHWAGCFLARLGAPWDPVELLDDLIETCRARRWVVAPGSDGLFRPCRMEDRGATLDAARYCWFRLHGDDALIGLEG